jgi:hypothetical protein
MWFKAGDKGQTCRDSISADAKCEQLSLISRVGYDDLCQTNWKIGLSRLFMNVVDQQIGQPSLNKLANYKNVRVKNFQNGQN